MSHKGTCPVCLEIRWIRGKNSSCKPCGYPTGNCLQCGHLGKMYVDGLCYCCYQHRQVDAKITVLTTAFKPMSEYNYDLFLLYLAYIRRYRLLYFHLRQVKKLAAILEQDGWSTINCWNDISILAERHNLKHFNKKDNGCAVIKIGYMLTELGILLPKDEDCSKLVARKLAQLSRLDLYDDVLDLMQWLERSGRRPSTIFNQLCRLYKYGHWIKTVYPGLDSRMVHESKIVEYLQVLQDQGYKPSQQRDSLLTLKRFFARLCYRKKIFANPCQNLHPSKTHAKINIVSDTDLKKLVAYIQNKSSPPEEALALALILFFGFKTEDLLRATIELVGSEHFRIVLHQSPRSYGQHHYNREQILDLPLKPDWLINLKIRFINHWQTHYAQVKQTYPTQRLILPRHHHYTRQLHPDTLLKRIYGATMVATGQKISLKVLRQTCGDLHTRNGDGSVLTTLGWSPYTAFHYTWLPRQIITSTDNSTRT